MKTATEPPELHRGFIRDGIKKTGKYTFIVKVPMKKAPPIPIPIYVIRGKKSGPVFLAAAGEHGHEVNGIAAIDRVFRGTNPHDLSGTFVGIPAINPINVFNRGICSDAEGYKTWDSVRAWPGDSQGSPAERIAAALVKAVIDDADVVINIHAWSWYSASCAFTSPHNQEAMHQAKIFGLPFVCFDFFKYCKGKDVTLHPKHNMLTHYVLAHGKPAMLVELRTHHWMYPPSVTDGFNGIQNVMMDLGMIRGEPILPAVQYQAFEEEIVRTPQKGLFVPLKSIADRVRKNEVLGYLLDLKTGKKMDMRSSCTGAIWLVSRVGKGEVALHDMHSYAEKGDMVALIKHVKTVRDIKTAA